MMREPASSFSQEPYLSIGVESSRFEIVLRDRGHGEVVVRVAATAVRRLRLLRGGREPTDPAELVDVELRSPCLPEHRKDYRHPIPKGDAGSVDKRDAVDRDAVAIDRDDVRWLRLSRLRSLHVLLGEDAEANHLLEEVLRGQHTIRKKLTLLLFEKRGQVNLLGGNRLGRDDHDVVHWLGDENLMPLHEGELWSRGVEPVPVGDVVAAALERVTLLLRAVRKDDERAVGANRARGIDDRLGHLPALIVRGKCPTRDVARREADDAERPVEGRRHVWVLGVDPGKDLRSRVGVREAALNHGRTGRDRVDVRTVGLRSDRSRNCLTDHGLLEGLQRSARRERLGDGVRRSLRDPKVFGVHVSDVNAESLCRVVPGDNGEDHYRKCDQNQRQQNDEHPSPEWPGVVDHDWCRSRYDRFRDDESIDRDWLGDDAKPPKTDQSLSRTNQDDCPARSVKHPTLLAKERIGLNHFPPGLRIVPECARESVQRVTGFHGVHVVIDASRVSLRQRDRREGGKQNHDHEDRSDGAGDEGNHLTLLLKELLEPCLVAETFCLSNKKCRARGLTYLMDRCSVLLFGFYPLSHCHSEWNEESRDPSLRSG